MKKWIIILILVTGFLVIRIMRFTPGPSLYVFDRWTGRVLSNVRPPKSEISVKKIVDLAIAVADKAKIRIKPNGKVVYLAPQNEPFLLAKEKSSVQGWLAIYLQENTYDKIMDSLEILEAKEKRKKDRWVFGRKVSDVHFVEEPYFISEKETKLEKWSYEEKEHKTTFWDKMLYFAFGSYDDSCIVRR